MMIAIRNDTGIDLHLAISAGEKSIRFRVTRDPPFLREGEEAEPLRAGHGHGIVGCPEGLRARVNSAGTGLAIRAAFHREILEDLDAPDGKETYLLITLRLMN